MSAPDPMVELYDAAQHFWDCNTLTERVSILMAAGYELGDAAKLWQTSFAELKPMAQRAVARVVGDALAEKD